MGRSVSLFVALAIGGIGGGDGSRDQVIDFILQAGLVVFHEAQLLRLDVIGDRADRSAAKRLVRLLVHQSRF